MVYELNDPSKAAPLFADWEDLDAGVTACLDNVMGKIFVTDPDHPVDIDRLLVMTFTNAAASEMRERIGAALEKRLEECQGDRNLEKQITLLNHAKITTIDRKFLSAPLSSPKYDLYRIGYSLRSRTQEGVFAVKCYWMSPLFITPIKINSC